MPGPSLDATTRPASKRPAGAVVEHRRMSPRQRLRRRPDVVLAVVAFVAYAAYSLSLWPQFGPAGFDLGIFDQAIRHYAHFKAPYVALKGPHYDLLGDHFHPILAVLAPLYWVWDDPRVLQVAQAALIAASIPVVYRFARRRVPEATALVWAGAYALGWPLQEMVNYNVHEVAFAVPLLALVVDALDRRLDRRLVVCCLLLLLVREDMGVLVAVVGLLVLLRGPGVSAGARARRRGRVLGAALIVVGVVGYWFVTSVAIPHFASDGSFAYWDYDALGPDAPSALMHIVAHPVDTATLFFSPWVKSQTMLLLLVPTAFLSLRSRYALLALPVLAERFFSSRESLWGTGFHYSAVIWPVLFLAALDAAHRSGLLRRPRPRRLLTAWVLAATLFGIATGVGPNPFHRVLDGKVFERTAHMRDQEEIVALIPPQVCVEVDDRLAPRLLHTNLVGIPGSLGLEPGLVALDLSQAEPGYLEPPTPWVLAGYEARGYTEIERRGSVILLRRPGGAIPSPGCGPFGQG